MGLFSRRRYDGDGGYNNGSEMTNTGYNSNSRTGNTGYSNNNSNVPNSGLNNSNNSTLNNAGHHHNSNLNNTGYNDNSNLNNTGYNRDSDVTNGGHHHYGTDATNHGYNNGPSATSDRYNDGYNNRNNRRSGGFFNRQGSEKRGRRGRRNTNEKRTLFDIDSGQYNKRPSFGQWLKFTWLDILTMAIMGAIGIGVYEAHPAPSRSFPVTFASGDVVYPEFAYPLRKEIVPIWAAALLGALVPIFVILCMQIRIRSFWDVNNAIIGLFYSLITAAVFQVFLKWLIGGLRPHFLAVCDPDPATLALGGNGFRGIMFQRNVCRGNIDQIDDSLESFPSGHSTAAWAGFLYLYFYLNAKLKVFSNYHPAMWKIIALYAPLLAATLITGALTIDEFHNWYDCLAGAIIGSVMAISAYRMVYASVWDFRFNHIPLTRHTPFSYGAGEAGAGGFESAVFTRQAGWGYEEAWGGAPFDAAHGLRGQMPGFNQGATRHQHGGVLGHGKDSKRDGDVEHNAVGTGTGYDNTTTNGHHHNHNRNDTLNPPSSTHHHTTIGGHNNTNNSSGGGILSSIMPGHHRNERVNDPVDNNATLRDPTSTRDSRDGRYHHHNRSLERKAVPAVPNNRLSGGDHRVSGEY